MYFKLAYFIIAIASLCFFSPTAHKITTGDVQLLGYVTGLPTYGETRTSFDFMAVEQGYLHLNWYGPRPLIQPGTGWKLWVKLKSLQDTEAYLKHRGFQGTATVEALKPWSRQFARDHVDLLNTWRFALRRKILGYANAVQVSEASHLLLALGIGDSSELNSRVWRVLQDTGTSHLVAISGLHIGLIGLLFYGIIRRLWSLSVHLSHRLAAQKAAALGGFIGALSYGLISGLGIPAERTLIMLGVAALYQFLGKTPGSFKAWALAFLICLVWQPWGIFSVSMWLSFLAVFALIFLLSHRIQLKSGILSHLKVQWALYCLLIPVTWYSFGVISTVALIVNVWAIPWVSFVVVPLLFLGMLLMMIPGLWFWIPGSCFYLAGKGASLWWFGLSLFSHWSYAGIYLPPPSLKATVLAEIGLFWCFAPSGIPGRWLGMLCTAPLWVLAVHHFLIFRS